jgi:hypothetical protein
MSYDLNIWTTKRLMEDVELTVKYGLKYSDDVLCYEAKTWQIILTRSLIVEEEDIPEEVQTQLPGIRYEIQLNLEPISAPRKARELLNRLARDIASKYNGVIEDPQESSYVLPTGVKRQVPPVRDERVSVVELNWYYTNQKLQQKEGFEGVVSVLAAFLPEALPKRYGLYEPPQHKYESKEALVEFLYENRNDLVVWYPQRPVLNVSFSLIDEAARWSRLGQFFCNTFTLTIMYDLFESDEWQVQIKRVWRKLTVLLDPFYGEVRRLDGYTYSRGRIYFDMQTQQGPTKSGFWKGIPKRLGTAIVLNDLYFALWKGLSKGNLYGTENGYHFLSLPDWSDKNDLSKVIGKPPKSIRQLKEPKYGKAYGGYTFIYNENYPRVFPFKWSDPSQ